MTQQREVQSVSGYELMINVGVQVSTFVTGGTVGYETGVAIQSDGSKLFICDAVGDSVQGFDLSTPFDVSSASLVNTLDVSGEDTDPTGIDFNADGTKLYVVGASGDNVYEYDLSTAYDLSSATYNSNLFSVSSQDSTPGGVAFGKGGSKMYVMGGSENVYEYDLSAGYNVTTATYNSNSFDVSGETSSSQDVAIDDRGRHIFVPGSNDNEVHKYSLGTRWDITTAKFEEALGLATSPASPSGVAFSPGGTHLYISDNQNGQITEYTL